MDTNTIIIAATFLVLILLARITRQLTVINSRIAAIGAIHIGDSISEIIKSLDALHGKSPKTNTKENTATDLRGKDYVDLSHINQTLKEISKKLDSK